MKKSEITIYFEVQRELGFSEKKTLIIVGVTILYRINLEDLLRITDVAYEMLSYKL